MVQTKKKERKELEDYEPGATRGDVLKAFEKAIKANGHSASSKDTNKTTRETDAIKKATRLIAKHHRKAFEELERH